MRNQFFRRLRRSFFGVLLCGCMAWGQELPTNSIPTQAPQRRPLVVLKQASIQGRAFFISEEADQKPAAKLRVAILDKEEKAAIFETKADEGGNFSLPNLDVGKYVIRAGRLNLELVVHSPEKANDEVLRIPKTILIFMPEALK